MIDIADQAPKKRKTYNEIFSSRTHEIVAENQDNRNLDGTKGVVGINHLPDMQAKSPINSQLIHPTNLNEHAQNLTNHEKLNCPSVISTNSEGDDLHRKNKAVKPNSNDSLEDIESSR